MISPFHRDEAVSSLFLDCSPSSLVIDRDVYHDFAKSCCCFFFISISRRINHHITVPLASVSVNILHKRNQRIDNEDNGDGDTINILDIWFSMVEWERSGSRSRMNAR